MIGTGLVEIQYPVAVDLPKDINEDILRESVRLVKKRLYVSLHMNVHHLTFDGFQELLIKYYDTMYASSLQANNPLLDTIIVIPSLAEYNPILKNADVNAYLCHFPKETARVETLRKELKSVTLSTNGYPITAVSPSQPKYVFPSYDTVAIAGTFDRLHGGHKRLLTLSSIVTQKQLVIGLLTPSPSKKYGEIIQEWEQRKEALESFIKTIKPSLSFTIEKINRCPSVQNCSLVSGKWNTKVDAIVSEDEAESLNGCGLVNNLRGNSGLKNLSVVKQKSSRLVSSSDLRTWVINHKSKL